MTESAPAAAPPLGLLARATGMITSPSATFRSVVARPRSAGILFLVCLLMGLATGLPQFTERGRAATFDMQVTQAERFSGQPITPETRQGMEMMARYSGYTTLISMFIFIPVVTIVVAGVYWLLFNVILGGTADFKQVLAVICHSQVILGLGTVLAAPIQYLTGTMTPAGPFHFGALAAPFDPSGSVARLLEMITVFGIWQSVVSGIGLAVLYRRKTTGIVIALLVIYVILTGFFSVFLPSLLSSAAGSR